jgi:DNA end-binding protein Ku
MPRAIWKGSLAFGLVHIPVQLLSAETTNELSFHLLDKHDLAPVGYERINKTSGKKVAWSDIVRGYEHTKGEFVVLSDRELAAANVEATHTIDILSFVDGASIDRMFFDKPYYLVADKQGKKAYELLRETLEKSGRVGIGKVVIRTRQRLAAIVARERSLAIVLLRYAHEVKTEQDLEIENLDKKATAPSARERALAEKLVEGMVEEWDPEQYQDEYRDDVLALVEKKVKAGQVNTVEEMDLPKTKRTKGAKVIDLMELLQRSVGAKGGKRAAADDQDHHDGGEDEDDDDEPASERRPKSTTKATSAKAKAKAGLKTKAGTKKRSSSASPKKKGAAKASRKPAARKSA